MELLRAQPYGAGAPPAICVCARRKPDKHKSKRLSELSSNQCLLNSLAVDHLHSSRHRHTNTEKVAISHSYMPATHLPGDDP